MSAASAAPVAMVLARRATAPFPAASRSPMIPDPTTAASKRHAPTASAVARRAIVRCISVPSRVKWRPVPFRSRRLQGESGVNKQRVLFLCTHNSARSQMAEGFLRALAGERFEVASAGTQATRVHPLAMRAMADIGIDISGQTSKVVDEFAEQPWDYVITVCDAANEACPVFPKKSSRLHWSFEDPSQASGSEDQRLDLFRRVRDQLKRRITDWIGTQ